MKGYKRRRDPNAMIFYVYALVDPRNDEEFYYGKGHGKRYAAHVAEWRRGDGYNKRKLKRIDDIMKAGCEVQVNIISEGLTEAQAFALEGQKIKAARAECRDLSNLGAGITNMTCAIRCDLEKALELVNHWLGRYRSKESFHEVIVRDKGRPPTLDERWDWLGGLKQLADIRRTVHRKMKDKYGEEIAIAKGARF